MKQLIEEKVRHALGLCPRVDKESIWVSDDGKEVSFLIDLTNPKDPDTEIDYSELPALVALEKDLGFQLEDEGDYVDFGILKVYGYQPE